MAGSRRRTIDRLVSELGSVSAEIGALAYEVPEPAELSAADRALEEAGAAISAAIQDASSADLNHIAGAWLSIASAHDHLLRARQAIARATDQRVFARAQQAEAIAMRARARGERMQRWLHRLRK